MNLNSHFLKSEDRHEQHLRLTSSAVIEIASETVKHRIASDRIFFHSVPLKANLLTPGLTVVKRNRREVILREPSFDHEEPPCPSSEFSMSPFQFMMQHSVDPSKN